MYILSTTIISVSLSPFSAPGSRQLVCITYYLVLSFLLMYSSSVLSTDVFPNKTNINTHFQNAEDNTSYKDNTLRGHYPIDRPNYCS